MFEEESFDRQNKTELVETVDVKISVKYNNKISSMRDRYLINFAKDDYTAILDACFLLIVTKYELIYAKEQFKDGVNKEKFEYMGMLYTMKKYLEDRPAALEQIKERYKMLSHIKLTTHVSESTFILEKNQEQGPNTIFRHAHLSTGGLTETGKKSDGKNKTCFLDYDRLTDFFIEEKKKDDTYCGQFVSKLDDQTFDWPSKLLNEGRSVRVICDGFISNIGKNQVVAQYCKNYPEAVNLKNQLIFTYRKLVPDYEGLFGQAIDQFKVRTHIDFFKKMCKYLMIVMKKENLWYETDSNLFQQLCGVNPESNPYTGNGDYGGGNGQGNLIDQGDENFIRNFKLNKGHDRYLQDLGHTDWMKYTFNGYKNHMNILPVLVIKAGQALESNFPTLPGFIQEIMVSIGEDIVLYNISLPMVYKNSEKGQHYYTWPESHKSSATLNFNHIFEKLEQQATQVHNQLLRFVIKYRDQSFQEFEDFYETNFWILNKNFYAHHPMIIDFYDRGIFLWTDFTRMNSKDSILDLEDIMADQRIIFDSFTWSRFKLNTQSPASHNILIKNTMALLNQMIGSDSEEIEDLLRPSPKYSYEVYRFISEKITMKSVFQMVWCESLKPDDWNVLSKNFFITPTMKQAQSSDQNFTVPDYIQAISERICPGDSKEFSSFLWLFSRGLHRNYRFNIWRNLVNRSKRSTIIHENIEDIVESLFKYIKEIDTEPDDKYFQIEDLRLDYYIRATKTANYQSKIGLVNQFNLSKIKSEISLIFTSITHLSIKGMLYNMSWAISQIAQTLYFHYTDSSPAMQNIKYAQKEVFILKYVLANLNPVLLKHIFCLSLSIEKLLMNHMANNQVELVNNELALMIRDIFFLVNFYKKEDKIPDYNFFCIFKGCIISEILSTWEGLLSKAETADTFENLFQMCCKTETNYEEIVCQALKRLNTLIEGQHSKEAEVLFPKCYIKGIAELGKVMQVLDNNLMKLDKKNMDIDSDDMRQYLDHAIHHFYINRDKGDRVARLHSNQSLDVSAQIKKADKDVMKSVAYLEDSLASKKDLSDEDNSDDMSGGSKNSLKNVQKFDEIIDKNKNLELVNNEGQNFSKGISQEFISVNYPNITKESKVKFYQSQLPDDINEGLEEDENFTINMNQVRNSKRQIHSLRETNVLTNQNLNLKSSLIKELEIEAMKPLVCEEFFGNSRDYAQLHLQFNRHNIPIYTPGHLQVLCNDKIMFETQMEDKGIINKRYLKFDMPKNSMFAIIRFIPDSVKMEKSMNVSKIDEKFKAYEGKLYMQRMKLNVVERFKILLKEIYPDQKNQGEDTTIEAKFHDCIYIDFTGILNTINKYYKLEDFKNELQNHDIMLHVENFWGLKVSWENVLFIDQNSYLNIEDYGKLSEKLLDTHISHDLFQYFEDFTIKNKQKLDFQPLGRLFLNNLFWSYGHMRDLMLISWKFCSFFDYQPFKINEFKNYVELASIKYIIKCFINENVLVTPNSIIENEIDQLFTGVVPIIRYAYILFMDEKIDATIFCRTLLNHTHYCTGRSDQFILRKKVIELFKMEVYDMRTLDQPLNSKLVIKIESWQGSEIHSITLNLKSIVEDCQIADEIPKKISELLISSKKRIIVENPRLKVSRGMFLRKAPQISYIQPLMKHSDNQAQPVYKNPNGYWYDGNNYYMGFFFGSDQEMQEMDMYIHFSNWEEIEIEFMKGNKRDVMIGCLDIQLRCLRIFNINDIIFV